MSVSLSRTLVTVERRLRPPGCSAGRRPTTMAMSDGRRCVCNKTAGSTTIDDEKTTKEELDKKWSDRLSGASSSNRQPKCLFPWRSESTLLPRLLLSEATSGRRKRERPAVFGPGIPPMPYWLESAVIHASAVQLSEQLGPWYRRLTYDWRQELADSASFAFAQGVSGVLRNTYQLEENFDSDYHHIDFPGGNDGGDNEKKTTNSSSSNDYVENLPKASKDANGESADEEEKDLSSDDSVVELHDMLESQLRQLYESAHEHGSPDRLSIRLQCEPKSADFVSLLWIPFLTREAVRKDNSLRNSVEKMNRALAEAEEAVGGRSLGHVESFNFFSNQLFQLADHRMVDEGAYGVIDSTVVLQVLVGCSEVFCVKDRQTGKVLQGLDSSEMRTVYHLVRLEQVLKHKFPKKGGRAIVESGRWQITDWDDLLDGNRQWFLSE